MGEASSDLIITLVTAYLLLIILLAIFILRFLSLSRARTKYGSCSVSGFAGGLLWLATILTTAYIAVGTMWWISLEKETEFTNDTSVNSPSPQSTPTVSDPLSAAAPGGGLNKRSHALVTNGIIYPESAVAVETVLAILYICVMWAVKGVYILLMRLAWKKVRKPAMIMWWVTVVAVGAGLVAVLVSGAAKIGMGMRDIKFHSTYAFIMRDYALIVGVVHICTSLLLIATSILFVLNLRPYFPPSHPPRTTGVLFASAFLSIIITTFRLSSSFSPSKKPSFIAILIVGELVLLCSVACMPSLVISQSASTSSQGHFMIHSNPSSPPHNLNNHSSNHSYRNRRGLKVCTTPTKVTASDFGYVVDTHHHGENHTDIYYAQGLNNEKVKSAPLFVPEKVQVRPTWDEKSQFHESSEEETSSSDEEMGRRRWGGKGTTGGVRGKVSSSRISGLRSGYEEGREWRRGGGDEVARPISARVRTPRGARFA